MLRLTNITKTYPSGDVTALQGVSIAFRPNEFVSILGPSGCGKTTLLNIIGGLDRYSSGELSVRGVPTTDFRDHDWDTYRNHSIGFVFQSYNLIPHQTVLANVELALTLSGVSRAERRRRAIDALEAVGLGDQLRKKPSQMSGGQMQRVAIARALVNDPDILLADEPTGALDSETSVQIMEILRKIAEKKLIIMVTHNPDLADQYSTRIIRLLDGKVIADSDPYSPEEEAAEVHAPSEADAGKAGKTSMSFGTAVSLSMNNLMTKKGRTFLTAFAGSIGIIGIALILSLSNGINLYIEKVQEDTLSTYPISIQQATVDMSSLMTSLMESREDKLESHEDGRIYSNVMMYDLMDTMMSADVRENNLTSFIEYIESEESGMADYASTIMYGYNVPLHIYSTD
ncbi:MAG: ABC transporter ATP-binding protein, partial [Clostridia bacterium]|nr:ABC transporter ATP-binding protein [Clostridia bacterium]